PKFEVDPVTGSFPFPPTDLSMTGDTLYKRLQAPLAEIHPDDNPGALYFGEAQYVTADDAAAGNSANNVAYRPLVFSPAFLSVTVDVGGITHGGPAIQAWAAADPAVVLTTVDVPGDGRFTVGARVVDLGDGTWRYEY